MLEFLHRVVDALEEFLGAPLLAHKIEANYDVVAQLLTEMCDAGTVSTTEPNALRDLVEVEGFMDKLLGNLNLPTYAPPLQLSTWIPKQARKRNDIYADCSRLAKPASARASAPPAQHPPSTRSTTPRPSPGGAPTYDTPPTSSTRT